jgi:hypothetical protein
VTYGLAQWPALSDGNLITLLNTESWRDVRSEVLVSLLVSGVFGDEVEVFSADDKGSVHLGGDNGSGQDTSTDGDEAGERALLVCDESALVSNSLALRHSISLSSPFRDADIPSHPIPYSHSLGAANKMRLAKCTTSRISKESTYRCRCPQWRSLVF